MKRTVGAFLAVVAGAGALVGCQKVTRSVSTSISPCFRVLPTAQQAVAKQGTLVDIIRLRGPQVTAFETLLREGAPAVTRPGVVVPSGGSGGAGVGGGGQPGVSPTVPEGRRDVCVVAFRGTFDPSRMQHLGRVQSGHFAIVIIGVETRLVRMVVVRDALPAPLHAH
jgi:hypothetical protein